VSVAKQFQHRGLSLNDLIDEGNIGLIEAVKRFDGSRGRKVITYAVYRIVQAIIEALDRTGNMVPVSDRCKRILAKILSAKIDFEKEHRAPPSYQQLADTTGYTKDQVVKVLSVDESFRTIKSLDQPLTTED
jgi:RNA polymerase primary sigma factor